MSRRLFVPLTIRWFPLSVLAGPPILTDDTGTPGSGPILAGFLKARYDYLYAFWFMAALLVLAVPVLVMNVKISRA